MGGGYHARPCVDWPFDSIGDHVVGDESWVRLDANITVLVETHACIDDDGRVVRSWQEVIDRCFDPEADGIGHAGGGS